MTGKKHITGADMRIGLENFVLDQARLAELGLAGFTGDLRETVSITKVADLYFSNSGLVLISNGSPTQSRQWLML